MLLFCCASELGPPEDLSAIEVRPYLILLLYWNGQLVLDTSSRTLFVREGGRMSCPRHVERRVT